MQPEAIAARLEPFLGGATLNETQLGQLATFLDLLLRWNARINLTAIRQPEQIVTRHFGESLFAARQLFPSWRLEPGAQGLLDIGSGAGFPGLPIKIYASALGVTLLESNHRKATFLREAVRALQLTGVDVLATRAEDYALQMPSPPSPAANSFTVTLRAVERFQQVLPTAVRLLQSSLASDRRLALLIGAAQARPARDIASSLAWSDSLPIPASTQRVLLIGQAQ
jgi:16S rRNA (guanine527-N7)-methyltransferase